MDKDVSLLREFDLDAAKRGEPVCWLTTGSIASHVFFVEDKVIPVFPESIDSGRCGILVEDEYHYLRMAPLCWVEGKPVYKGDVLWYKDNPFSIKVTGPNEYDPENVIKGVVEFSNYAIYTGGETTWAPFDRWTWTAPAPKTVKMLCHFDGDQLFWLREGAELKWPSKRVPSEDKVIEVEE